MTYMAHPSSSSVGLCQYGGILIGEVLNMRLILWSTLLVGIGIGGSYLEKHPQTLVRIPNNLCS